jgi:hypothetical protein
MAAAGGRLPSHRPLHSPTLKRLQPAVMAISIPSAVPARSVQLLSLVTRTAKFGSERRSQPIASRAQRMAACEHCLGLESTQYRPLDQTACRWQLPRYNGHSCLRASRQVLGRSSPRSINKSTANTGCSTGNRRAVRANRRFDRQITVVNDSSLPVIKFERTSGVRPEMDGHVVQTSAIDSVAQAALLWPCSLSNDCGEDRREAVTCSGHRQTVVLTGRGMFDFLERKNQLKDGATRRVCARPKSSPVRLDD